MPLRFLHILFLLIPVLAFSQDFNYVHYSTRDGLAGSTVYDVCQDKSGYIFFATENGLSRYDGTHIKNYTVKDGLPDNEVLKVFSDSRGRTWISTFNKEICFYFDGKIYNKYNDSLVRKINLNNIFSSAAEDDEGTIALCDTRKIVLIHRLKNNQESLKVITIPGKSTVLPFWSCNGKKILVGNDLFERYLYENGTMRFFHKTDKIFNGTEYSHTQIALHTTCSDSIDKTVPSIPGSISASVFNNYMIYYNTTNGVWQTDTVLNKWGNHFLPGIKVSRTITDTENNTWFATLGDGVYKLPSPETKTIRLPEQPDIRNEIFSLGKYGNQLLGGLDQSGVLFVYPYKKSLEKKSGEIRLPFSGHRATVYLPSNR